VSTSLPHPARVLDVSDDSPTVRTLVLDRCLRAEPGQFVMAWLPGVNERPFSLVSAQPVTLTIARVGAFTEAVHRLRPGDRLWLRGPLGQGFRLPQPGPQAKDSALLLVAGGYGVAPLYFLASVAVAAGWRVDVAIGARTAVDVIFVERFAALGAQVAVTTDDGSRGQKGFVTDAAARLLDGSEHASIYACGPEPMLAAVESLARSRRLPAQLSYERAMRCGFGVCGTCSRLGWLVCRDGPVLAVEP